MNAYPELSLLFDEDRLPPGQQPIVTAGIRQFRTASEMLMHSKQTGYSTMGVVTGWPGVGKTIAIQAFLLSLLPQPHTGLPPCVVIKVKPGSNSRQLVVDLLKSFGDNPRSLNANRFKMADEAAEAILSNDLKILFVDDPEQLNAEGFDFLRYIYAKTAAPSCWLAYVPLCGSFPSMKGLRAVSDRASTFLLRSKRKCCKPSCCGAGKSRRGPTRPLNFSCWEMTRTMGRKPTSTMGQRSWHKCSAESRSLPRSVVRDRRQTGSSSRCSGWPRLPHRPF